MALDFVASNQSRFEHSRLPLPETAVTDFRVSDSSFVHLQIAVRDSQASNLRANDASRRSRHLGGASVVAVSLDWSTGLTATGRHRDNY